MAEAVLKRPDLDMKTCLEAFKESPFTLEHYLNSRSECLRRGLQDYKGDFAKIISVLIREVFTDTLRQAFTIFSNREAIYKFTSKEFVYLVEELRRILKENKQEFDRAHLTQLWHSTVLAGEGLSQYSADFSPLLEDLFVKLISDLVLSEFEERLKRIDCSVDGQVELGEKYDLNKTLVLNAVVDLINQVRLCPESEKLKEKVFISAVGGNLNLSEEIKTFAKNHL